MLLLEEFVGGGEEFAALLAVLLLLEFLLLPPQLLLRQLWEIFFLVIPHGCGQEVIGLRLLKEEEVLSLILPLEVVLIAGGLLLPLIPILPEVVVAILGLEVLF